LDLLNGNNVKLPFLSQVVDLVMTDQKGAKAALFLNFENKNSQ
jgi:hypothetical protein